jgi:hypothetical protein
MQTSGINSFSPWLLDSDATDHMCPNKDLFLSLKPISPIFVKLPNRSSVIAHFAGTIQIGSLLLHNALFVPDFDFHLISITKLASSLHYLVIFSDTDCITVQQKPLKTIGVARKEHGLFHLLNASNLTSSVDFVAISNSVKTCMNLNSVDNSFLWHLRLGHVSNKIIEVLSQQYTDFPFNVSDACDACQFAKQKCRPYTLLVVLALLNFLS